MTRFSARLLCAVAAAALLPSAPAAAQTVTRIVAFGDSYADEGNFFELTGISTPVYPTGRFSGGTNFIDTMSRLLNAPVDNFAIGGAFTNNGNINGPGIPGFTLEYQSFLAGGGPAFFPRVSGKFGPTDLLAISIGGNDARAYQFGGGTVAGAGAAAAPRVVEATTGLNALVAAGARNITFLAGDVGRLPEVRGTPIAAVGSAFAGAFNTGIQASLSNIAAQGVIVNYLDLNLIGTRVESNLAAYGLTNAGACPAACVSNPALQSQYLFYADRVHLTSAGFAIVGQYAVRQLEAPLHLQAQTDIGLQNASTFGSTLVGRLDLSNARMGTQDGGLHFFLTANGARRDVDRTTTNLPYDMDTFGATGGAEIEAAPGTVFGAALNYSKGEAEIGSSGGADTTSMQLGVYGGWSGGGAFAQVYAGYGWLDHRYKRDAVIDEISGKSDGNSTIAGVKAGYLIGAGNLRFGPVIGVQYAKADVDAYTETGDPVLTNNVGKQDVKALTGSAGIEARANYSLGRFGIQPYGSVMLEKDFEGDSRTVRYAGTASPTIVNSFVLPDRSKDMYGRLAGGANVGLGVNAALQVNATTTIGQDGSEDVGGFIGVKIGF
jgi:outer membrane autotransporter protein